MTIEQLAATGLRGKALTDAVYEDILGTPPPTPAKDRTPSERRASLERLFTLMRTLNDEELDDNFMSDVRPGRNGDAHASAA